jgi:hypothetical protein
MSEFKECSGSLFFPFGKQGHMILLEIALHQTPILRICKGKSQTAWGFSYTSMLFWRLTLKVIHASSQKKHKFWPQNSLATDP